MQVCADDSVSIRDAWIAEAPAAAAINAGYLEIDNQSGNAISLISVTSRVFSRVEIHKSITENDITRMEHFPTITIGPGEQFTFRPGDFHLMLYNADHTLKSGDVVTLSLAFSDGTTREAQARVRQMPVTYQHQTHETEVTTGTTMFTGIKVFYQHLLPQHLLSGLMYRLTRVTWTPLKNFLITSFIRIYNVDMSIAARPDPADYVHFNDFFTRGLTPSARLVDGAADAVVSPVDGIVSQAGTITGGKLIQAKGMDYSIEALLAGDQTLANTFANGDFITLYLSPRDYHRIHMPVTGTLKSMSYIPGDLFSVNPATTETIDKLFARNERVIQVFDTEIGSMALIMVGAIFVGSMETVWAGQLTPATGRNPSIVDYTNSGKPVRLLKGEEMGRFNMGSTVILLFENNRLSWENAIQAEYRVELGQKIGRFRPPTEVQKESNQRLVTSSKSRINL